MYVHRGRKRGNLPSYIPYVDIRDEINVNINLNSTSNCIFCSCVLKNSSESAGFDGGPPKPCSNPYRLLIELPVFEVYIHLELWKARSHLGLFCLVFWLFMGVIAYTAVVFMFLY